MLDAPELVKIGDKEYKVEGFTQKIQDSFEKYMQYHLLSILKESKEAAGEDYLPLLGRHFQDVKLGKMSFGSEVFFNFIRHSDEHFSELLWYCFSAQDVTVAKRTIEGWVKENGGEAVDLFNRLCESKKK